MPRFTGDPTCRWSAGPSPRTQREEKIRRLKELFQQAVAYDDGRKHSSDQPVNPRLEALVPYARGKKPVIIQANRKQEILDALKLADELKIKLILSGGIDAWKVADELKKRDVPVIVGPIMTMPEEAYDPYDAPLCLPCPAARGGRAFLHLHSLGRQPTRVTCRTKPRWRSPMACRPKKV